MTALFLRSFTKQRTYNLVEHLDRVHHKYNRARVRHLEHDGDEQNWTHDEECLAGLAHNALLYEPTKGWSC